MNESVLKRLSYRYAAGLFLFVILIAALHLIFPDLKEGGVYWFNLDKERNFPTWFSGFVFFLFGSSALVAGLTESTKNKAGEIFFRFPVMWLIVAGLGFGMCLDEITVLHENLFWKEVRHVSTDLDGAWKYMTQWQIVFAPLILFAGLYFIWFFSLRFYRHKRSMICIGAGMSCGMLSIFLEGIRGNFKLLGVEWYRWQVTIEEMMEVNAAIFFLLAISLYVIDISTNPLKGAPSDSLKKLSAKIFKWLVLFMLLFTAMGATIFIFAKKQQDAGASVSSLMRRAAREGDVSLKYWFSDLTESRLRISKKDASELMPVIFQSLKQGVGIPQDQFTHLDTLKIPVIVFLSAGDHQVSARVVPGSGLGVLNAINDALKRSLAYKDFPKHPKMARLDLVTYISPLETIQREEEYDLELGVEGFAFEKSPGVAFLPGEILSRRLVTSKGKVRFEAMAAYLEKEQKNPLYRSLLFVNGKIGVRRFKTESFYFDGEQTFPLFRDRKIESVLTSQRLTRSTQSAARYLVRSTDDKGRFIYLYDPVTGKEDDGYNIVRHAGTLYSMYEIYERFKDPDVLETANRAKDYLLKFVHEKDGESYVIYKNRTKIKLGAGALALVALAKHAQSTGDMQHLELMRSLARYLVGSQDAQGKFISQRRISDFSAMSFESDYYPGESILGLVRLYALDPNDLWLTAAERGARYLIEVRDAEVETKDLLQDHWLLYALRDLQHYRPQDIFKTQTYRIAQAMIQSQARDPKIPYHAGSFNGVLRSTPTATRSEGLLAAYHLAQAEGDRAKAEEILEAAMRAVKFQLSTQFTPESVMFLKRPKKALGAFAESLTRLRIRNDFVQHNVSSLLALEEILSPKTDS